MKNNLLLLFCFFPLEVAAFSSSLLSPSSWPQPLPAAQSRHCGVCPAQILYQRVGEIGEMSMRLMWELNTAFELWRRGDNQCVWIHLGIYWQTLNRYPGRARVNRNVHYPAMCVYILLEGGTKAHPLARIMTLPNVTSLLQTIVTLKYSQKREYLVGFVLTI